MTRRWALPATVLALALLAVPRPAASGAGDGHRSDTWLKAALFTTYMLNEHLNSMDIDVEVDAGVATLTGRVDSAVEQVLAGELARATEGIREVRNKLVIAPATGARPGGQYDFRGRFEDASTTARVKSRLLWNAATRGTRIAVDTRDGVVSLEGRVASAAEAELVARIARETRGVRSVDARLEVDPGDGGLRQQAEQKARALANEIDDAWITARVKASLLYTRGLDGTGIHVETRDGAVRLRGTVDGRRAMERAIRTAGGIVGVRDVRSELTLAADD